MITVNNTANNIMGITDESKYEQHNKHEVHKVQSIKQSINKSINQ